MVRWVPGISLGSFKDSGRYLYIHMNDIGSTKCVLSCVASPLTPPLKLLKRFRNSYFLLLRGPWSLLSLDNGDGPDSPVFVPLQWSLITPRYFSRWVILGTEICVNPGVGTFHSVTKSPVSEPPDVKLFKTPTKITSSVKLVVLSPSFPWRDTVPIFSLCRWHRSSHPDLCLWTEERGRRELEDGS